MYIICKLGVDEVEEFVPASEEDEEEEDGLPKETDNRRTSVLAREAAASAGISRKRVTRGEETLEAPRGKVAKKAPGGLNMITKGFVNTDP